MPVEVVDYRGINAQQQGTAISEYQEADLAKGFDLQAAPLMRLALMRLDERRHRMLWTWHHILLDGWSLPVLMQEFLRSMRRSGQVRNR